MIYEFTADDGSVYELERTMQHAPPIGSRLVIEGKVFMRFPPKNVRMRFEPNYKLTSPSLPLHWPYAKEHDELGRPRFESKRAIDEAVAKGNDHGENIAFDHGGMTGS